MQAHLRTTNESLNDFKRRASDAEVRCLFFALFTRVESLSFPSCVLKNKLQAAQNDSEKLLALTKEVKDKTLLVGKLRHEGAPLLFAFVCDNIR